MPVTVKVATVVVPDTATVSSSSSTSSSVGARVKVAVCDRVPAPIVIVKSLTVAKSVPAVAVPVPTLTTTGVALKRAPPSSAAVTVIVVAPADSPTSWLSTDSSTPVEADVLICRIPSSSTRVRALSAGAMIPSVFVADPFTATVLSAVSRTLSTAVIVTVPVLDFDPAAIVSSLFALRL